MAGLAPAIRVFAARDERRDASVWAAQSPPQRRRSLDDAWHGCPPRLRAGGL